MDENEGTIFSLTKVKNRSRIDIEMNSDLISANISS